MKTRHPDREKGTAAVELAIICAMAITIIPFIFLFGRVFWHYNVLKQAAFDAAHYVASATTSRMAGNASGVASTAEALIVNAMSAAGMEPGVSIMIMCPPQYLCPQTSSGTVRVIVRSTLTDPGFAAFNWMFLDYQEFQISATAEVPYESRLPTP